MVVISKFTCGKYSASSDAEVSCLIRMSILVQTAAGIKAAYRVGQKERAQTHDHNSVKT